MTLEFIRLARYDLDPVDDAFRHADVKWPGRLRAGK